MCTIPTNNPAKCGLAIRSGKALKSPREVPQEPRRDARWSVMHALPTENILVDQHYPVAIRYCLRANGIPYRAGRGNYAL